MALAFILLGAAVAAALLWSAFGLARQRAVAKALAAGTLSAAKEGSGPERARAWWRQWKESAGRMAARLLPGTWKLAAEESLRKAGMKSEVGELVLACLASSLLGAVVLGAVALDPLAAVAGFALGAVVPVLRVRDQAEKRIEQVQSQMPDAVDLMVASVSAGLGFEQSLARVLPLLPAGPLALELSAAQKQMRLGSSASEALRAMDKRLYSQDVSEWVLTITQSIRQGLPLGPALRAQAKQIRALRALRAQKRAAQAPIKLLFPLMVFILPVVFLVLLGPIYLAWQGGGF